VAKIHMAQVAGLPVRTLRRMVGIPAHRPSGFNACIGAALKGKSYSKPPVGMGGQNNKAVQSAFISAVNGCKGRRGG
jgi:hypothetical protein